MAYTRRSGNTVGKLGVLGGVILTVAAACTSGDSSVGVALRSRPSIGLEPQLAWSIPLGEVDAQRSLSREFFAWGDVGEVVLWQPVNGGAEFSLVTQDGVRWTRSLDGVEDAKVSVQGFLTNDSLVATVSFISPDAAGLAGEQVVVLDRESGEVQWTVDDAWADEAPDGGVYLHSDDRVELRSVADWKLLGSADVSFTDWELSQAIFADRHGRPQQRTVLAFDLALEPLHVPVDEADVRGAAFADDRLVIHRDGSFVGYDITGEQVFDVPSPLVGYQLYPLDGGAWFFANEGAVRVVEGAVEQMWASEGPTGLPMRFDEGLFIEQFGSIQTDGETWPQGSTLVNAATGKPVAEFRFFVDQQGRNAVIASTFVDDKPGLRAVAVPSGDELWFLERRLVRSLNLLDGGFAILFERDGKEFVDVYRYTSGS